MLLLKLLDTMKYVSLSQGYSKHDLFTYNSMTLLCNYYNYTDIQYQIFLFYILYVKIENLNNVI